MNITLQTIAEKERERERRNNCEEKITLEREIMLKSCKVWL